MRTSSPSIKPSTLSFGGFVTCCCRYALTSASLTPTGMSSSTLKVSLRAVNPTLFWIRSGHCEVFDDGGEAVFVGLLVVVFAIAFRFGFRLVAQFVSG